MPATSTRSPMLHQPGLLVAGDDLDIRTKRNVVRCNIHRVRSELIAEVRFAGWSGEGRVRHPVFVGLREDKAPAEVVLEVQDPRSRVGG